MGVVCVNKNSTEFKEACQRLNVSEANLELAVHQFINEAEANNDKWPSDDYIKERLRGEPIEVIRTEQNSEVLDKRKKTWEEKYREPKTFPTKKAALGYAINPRKLFGSEHVGIYETADHQWTVWVGEFMEVTAEQQAEELEQLLEEMQKTATAVTVAPYFKTQFSKETTEQLTKEVQQKFLNAAMNVSKALGINITLIRDNIGGYTTEDNMQLRELSYTIEFDETDYNKAQLFASLLSDLGHQVQESVIVSSYVEDTATNYTGVETFIECDTSDRHAVADALESAGIHDYTINNEGVKVIWFDTQEHMDALKSKDKESLTKDETDNLKDYDTFVEAVNHVAEEVNGTLYSKKLHSNLLKEEAREQLYKDILEQLEDERKESEKKSKDITESFGRSLGQTQSDRRQAQEYNRQLSELVNEALKNLQAYIAGERGIDLTNQWQQREGEHQLNVPLTPTQLARSQLEQEEAGLSQEGERKIQEHQNTIYEQFDKLLKSSVVTRGQVNTFATLVGQIMVDYIEWCKNNQSILAETYPNLNLSERNLQTMSYAEIINTIGLDRFLKNVKESISDLMDNVEEDEVWDKIDLLTEECWDIVQALAFRTFNWYTGLSLGITNTGVATTDTKKQTETPIVEKENVNDSNETADVEESEGDELEHWQMEMRTISTLNSMSKEIKIFLASLTDIGVEEGKVDYKMDPITGCIKMKVDPVKATNQLLYILQGCRNAQEMLAKLKQAIGKGQILWANPLIEKLTVSSNKDVQNANAQFQSSFFTTFCKNNQQYRVVVKEKGKWVTKVLNASENVLYQYINHIQGLQRTGTNPLFTSEGVSEVALASLKSNKEAIAQYKQGQLSEKKVMAAVVNTLGQVGIKNIASTVQETFMSMPNNVRSALLSKVNSLIDEIVALEGKSISNMENALANTLAESGNRIIPKLKEVLTPLISTLSTEQDTVTFYNGKTYQRFTLPSYLTELMQKLSTFTGNELKEFMQQEYGRYSWFRNESGWRLSFLKQIANGTLKLSHSVQLGCNGKSPMKEMTERDYILSSLTQFFCTTKTTTKEGQIIETAAFATPIMSNKPTMEFIDAPVIHDEEQLLNNFMEIVFQELDRIQTIRMRDFNNGDSRYIQNFDKQGRKFNFLPMLNEFLEGGKEVNSQTGKLLAQKLNNKPLTKEQTAILYDGLRDAIKVGIDTWFERAYTHYESLGLLEELSKIDTGIKDVFKGLEKEQLKEKLKEFYQNQVFFNMMFLELTIGDIAYYKNAEDLQKRLAQLHAPGNKPNTSVVYNGQRVSDGKHRVVYLNDFENVVSGIKENLRVVFDRKIEEAIQNNQKDSQIYYENLKLKLLGDPSKGIKGAYDMINVTDGQAYNSITSYRKKALLFGKWKESHEEIYQRLRDGNYTASDLQEAFGQVLKPFTYTQMYSEVNVVGAPLENLKVPTQIKDSEYLLIFADTILQSETKGKPNLLRAISKVMEESHYDKEGNYKEDGIDTVVFSSAVKCGGHGSIDIAKYANDVDGEALAEAALRDAFFGEDRALYVQEFDYADYRIQQNVPDHFKEHYQAWGSQFRILGISEIMDGKTDAEIEVNGKTWKVGELQRHYENLHAQNIDASIKAISRQFGLIDKEGKPLSRMALNEKISKILYERILMDPQYDWDMLYAVKIDYRKEVDGKPNPNYGEFMMPLNDPSHAQEIEQLLNAYIKQRVNKEKIAGGPVVQVSSFGHSKQLNIRFKDKKGNLLMSRAEYEKAGLQEHQSYEDYCKANQHSIAYFEVLAPNYYRKQFERFADKDGNINLAAIEALNPDLLKMISSRIPTEDKYSMAPLKIVGFLPKEAGDGMMLPEDITLITGSDFDVDKMYCILKEIYVHDRTKSKKDLLEVREKVTESLTNGRNLNVNQSILLENVITTFFKDPMKKDVILNYRTDLNKIGLSYAVVYKTLLKAYVKAQYYSITPTAKDESKAGRNNELFDINYGILTHPSTMDKMFNPGNFDRQKKYAYMVALMKDPANTYTWEQLETMDIDAMKDLVYKNNSLIDPLVNSTFYKQNAAAAKLVGIFAVNRTSHAFLENDLIQLDLKAMGVSIPTIGDSLTYINHHVDESFNVDNIYIGKILAEFVASAVDAAKDPVLNLLNINGTTVQPLVTMVRLGFSFKDICLFLSQQSVSEILQKADIDGVSSPAAIGKIVEETMESLMKEHSLTKDSQLFQESITTEELIQVDLL